MLHLMNPQESQMAKLESYLARKAAAVAQRQADYQANPDAAIVTLTASSKVAGITGARPTRMGETTVISDSGPGLAGHALGPTAPEMLLGALASCLVHTYLLQSVLLNIPIDHVEVNVSGTLDYAGVVGLPREQPSCMQNLSYVVHLESDAPPEQIAQIHAAVEATCPVLNTLRMPVEVIRKNVEEI
jgi:uncharacterized OsmC-like protein